MKQAAHNTVRATGLGIYLNNAGGQITVNTNTVIDTTVEGISVDNEGLTTVNGNTYAGNEVALTLFKPGVVVSSNTFTGSGTQVSDANANYEATDGVSLEIILSANTFPTGTVITPAGGVGPRAIVTP